MRREQPATYAVPLREDVDQLDRPRWLPRSVWPFTLRRHRLLLAEGPVDLHYVDEGVGPVLVFVHAGPWSLVWRDAIGALRRDFRCIAVDLPGSGLSGGRPRHADLATAAEVLRRMLDGLHVERATLVLHGLGGVVGVHGGVRAATRIEGIVAVEAVAGTLPVALRRRLRVLGSRPAVRVLGGVRAMALSARFGHGVGRHLDAGGRAALLWSSMPAGRGRHPHQMARSARWSPALLTAADHLLRTRLGACPVLVVTGDDVDGLGAGWRRPGSSTVTWEVPGSGHLPMLADAAGFADRVRAWHRAAVVREA